jgi:hypothetical protein
MINDIFLSIQEAHRHKNILTPEEIVRKFPHAVSSFKYVDGKLKITLHKLPRLIIPFN